MRHELSEHVRLLVLFSKHTVFWKQKIPINLLRDKIFNARLWLILKRSD